MIEDRLASFAFTLALIGMYAFVYGVATIIGEIKKERDDFASRLDYFGRLGR